MSKLQKLSSAPTIQRPGLEEVDAAIHPPATRIGAPDAGRQTAKLTPIVDIWPDRRQPRKLPSAARADWDGDPAEIRPVFERWFALAEAEAGHPVDLISRLYQSTDQTPLSDEDLVAADMGPIERSLLKLIDLAGSIRRDGLKNPITVCRVGPNYRIETGERRWLAHHLLLLTFQEEDQWARILAHTVEVSDVWAQAAENGARQDLNAIGKARQLALLLMDIFTQAGATFADYDALVHPGQCDRAYYAQVADGEQYRIPRGVGPAILSAMGLTDVGQIRKYRALLRLDDPTWTMADDRDLTEREIRDLPKAKKTSVPQGTVSKPVTLKLSAQGAAAARWGEIKARMPETPDDELLASILEFWLQHREER